MSVRSLWLGLWIISGLALIYVMLRLLGASATEVFSALHKAPVSMYAVVIVLTAANQIVGALKWRAAARWLATNSGEMPLLQMVETTSVGSFFGQIIPPQISAVAARWLLALPVQRQGGWAVKATLFEQLFDLLILVCAGLAGLSVFMLDLSASAATGVAAAALVLGVAGLRIGFWMGWRLCCMAMSLPLGQGMLRLAADSFARAHAAPPGLIFKLSLWSMLRLLLVAFRAVLIAGVLAPTADPLLVAAGYPAAGLIGALPIAPAGLGVMEWTWSGVLIASGAPASSAAITALGFRMVNLVSLSAIIAAFAMLRLLRRVL